MHKQQPLMQTLQALDYLIFLSIETTHDSESFKFNYRKLFTDIATDSLLQQFRIVSKQRAGQIDSGIDIQPQFINDVQILVDDPDFPNIIQIDWQAYEVKKNEVTEKESLIIRPSNMAKVKSETHSKTGVNAALIDEKGIPLSEGVKKFSQFVYEKLILENKSFQLVTFGDWVFNYQFPIECAQKNIKLGPHFAQYSNLLLLALEVYGPDLTAKLQTPQDFVTHFTFDDDVLDIKLRSTLNCELMARFFKNHLLNTYDQLVLKRVYSPTMTFIQNEEVKAGDEPRNGSYSPSAAKPRQRSRSRSPIEDSRIRKSDSDEQNSTSDGYGYILISKLSPETSQVDIFKVMPDTIKVKDILFGLDENADNQSSRYCIIQLQQAKDVQELINMKISSIKDKEVQVEESAKKEFQRLAKSLQEQDRPSKHHQSQRRSSFGDEQSFAQQSLRSETSGPAVYPNLKATDYVSLRMRGLPFNIKHEDILSFFKDYHIYEDSVKIGRNQDNTKTGEGTLLFRDEQECKRAFQQKQGQNIAHRWIELYLMTYADYLNFEEMQQRRKTIRLNKYITESNLNRVLKLRGLPYSVTPEMLIDFFSDYNLSRSDVVIEEMNGKKTGYGLAFFANQQIAQQAKKQKHKQSLGSRYVELLDCTPQDITQ